MKVFVRSRREIEDGFVPSQRAVLISITDPDRAAADTPDHYSAVLRLSFDDVDYARHGVLITAEDAARVADFVRQHHDADSVVCHCEAGLSRSAGVAAAISEAVNGSSEPIFRIRPFLNRTVYRAVLNAFCDTTKSAFGPITDEL